MNDLLHNFRTVTSGNGQYAVCSDLYEAKMHIEIHD